MNIFTIVGATVCLWPSANLASALVEARQDARRRHQRNLEQRTPAPPNPTGVERRPAGRSARTVTSRPMFWSTRRAG